MAVQLYPALCLTTDLHKRPPSNSKKIVQIVFQRKKTLSVDPVQAAERRKAR